MKIKNLLFALSIFFSRLIPNAMEESQQERTEIKEIEKGFLYYAKKSNDLFFVFEKVTKDNHEQWRGYVQEQSKLLNYYSPRITFYEDQENLDLLTNSDQRELYEALLRQEAVIRGMSDPLDFFKKIICSYKIGDSEHELFVAYVTNQEPKRSFNLSDLSNIEISVGVLTHPEAPFQTHIGIARGMKYIVSRKESHRNLATSLHCFSAKAMQLAHPGKVYMITTPMTKMSEILKHKLSEYNLEDACWEGYNNGSSPILLGLGRYNEGSHTQDSNPDVMAKVFNNLLYNKKEGDF